MVRNSDWAAVFDVDGTIIPKEDRSLISILDKHALPSSADAEMERMRDKYLPRAKAGKLSLKEQEDWLRGTLDIYIRHGLSMKNVDMAMALVDLRPGVRDCLQAIHEAGIPVAMISAIYDLALTTGANRVIRGARIEHICGDPELGPGKDFAYGMEIVRMALAAIQTAVPGPTLFEPGKPTPPREAMHVS